MQSNAVRSHPFRHLAHQSANPLHFRARVVNGIKLSNLVACAKTDSPSIGRVVHALPMFGHRLISQKAPVPIQLLVGS